MKISVIIPTYNRADLLEKCLESFCAQTFSPEDFEVLVIDDGSQDNTRNLLTKKQFPFTLRPFFQSHGGAAKARNHGIDNATGNILVFTDDDCFPNPTFLAAHWRSHQNSGNRVVRGPILLIPSWEEMEGKAPGWSHWSANFFCTSNVSIRRDRLAEAGNFNERFTRWEDAELGYRLRKLGLQRNYIWDAFVFHLKPAQTVEDLIKTALADGRSAAQLFRTHPGLRTWLAAGLHPFSLLAGKIFQPLAQKKVAQLNPKDSIHGFWRSLIFQAYFIQGLKGPA